MLPRCERVIEWAGKPLRGTDSLSQYTLNVPGTADFNATLTYAPALYQVKVPLKAGQNKITATFRGAGSGFSGGALPKAGGPYDLVVSGDGAVTLTDVLVGDVWLGSGQSNMELPMTRTHDAAEKIAQAVRTSMKIEGYPPTASAEAKKRAQSLLEKHRVQISVQRGKPHVRP